MARGVRSLMVLPKKRTASAFYLFSPVQIRLAFEFFSNAKKIAHFPCTSNQSSHFNSENNWSTHITNIL